MAAPKGNQFWKARSKHGRDKIFTSSEMLWDSCCEYFQWVEDNPLMSAELVKFQGVATVSEVPKMRAMTIAGLCIFLDIDETTWRDYRSQDDFSTVITRVEQIIYQQKFSGAAADMLNPNIIARDLGLADKKELTGANNGPIEHREAAKLTPEEIEAELISRGIHPQLFRPDTD